MAVAAPHVLVLGAGINGCAIARELAINGVAVTLVDRGDIACGATAYSSRLIHGGLRYLEFAEFDLVRESLDERGRLLRLAAAYVRPLELMIPVAGRGGGWCSAALRFVTGGRLGGNVATPRGLWLVRMGLWLYDRYARDKSLPKHRSHRVGEPGTPPVDAAAYRWLVAYWDAQVEYPERFTLALLHDAGATAATNGTPFEVFTYHRVRRAGGRIELLSVNSAETATQSIEPNLIVNATGASVDRALADLAIASPPLMGPTKGSHFVTRNAKLIAALAGRGIYAEAADGRPVFVLPLGDAVLVGTTDVPFDASPETAVASEDELDYLVATVAGLFPNVAISRGDVDFHYAGVRPLPRSDAASTAGVTRRHAIVEHAPPEANAAPVLSVIGGKLTTCRALAEVVADRVLDKLGRQRQASTRERPLTGDANAMADPDELAESFTIAPAQAAVLGKLFGARATSVLNGIVESPAEFGPLATSLEGVDIPEAVVRWSIRREWAQTLDDLVERRLMLLYHPRLTRTSLVRLAEILADEGKLVPADVDEQVEATIVRLDRHYGKRVYDT